MFGESYQKYQRACDIDKNIVVFDHSKHYINGSAPLIAETVTKHHSGDPESIHHFLISPLDTSVTRRKISPAIRMAQSKSTLFGHGTKTFTFDNLL